MFKFVFLLCNYELLFFKSNQIFLKKRMGGGNLIIPMYRQLGLALDSLLINLEFHMGTLVMNLFVGFPNFHGMSS